MALVAMHSETHGNRVSATRLYVIPTANGTYEINLGRGQWRVVIFVIGAVTITVNPLAINGTAAGTYMIGPNNIAPAPGPLAIAASNTLRIFANQLPAGSAAGQFPQDPHVIDQIQVVTTGAVPTELTLLATRVA